MHPAGRRQSAVFKTLGLLVNDLEMGKQVPHPDFGDGHSPCRRCTTTAKFTADEDLARLLDCSIEHALRVQLNQFQANRRRECKNGLLRLFHEIDIRKPVITGKR